MSDPSSKAPLTVLHILWGREAVQRYRAGIMDTIVRLNHAHYAFEEERDAQIFLYALGVARESGDWAQITNSADLRRLGVPLRSRLIAAVRAGNVQAVKDLVDIGVSVSITDERGMTPLHWAARNGQDQIAELLITKGAALDEPAAGMDHATPLHLACESPAPGAAQVVSILLANNANPNSSDANGNRPLHSALSGSDQAPASVKAKLIDLVVHAKVDPRHENNVGETALDGARRGMTDSPRLLADVETVVMKSQEHLQHNEDARLARFKEKQRPNRLPTVPPYVR